MAIPVFYSNRNKPLPDIYSYDTISTKLKNQIIHIWNEFYNQIDDDAYDDIWSEIELVLAKMHGKKTLLENGIARWTENYKVEFYFENNQNIDECLDIIECTFRVMMNLTKLRSYQYKSFKFSADEAINDLNTLFLENGVGYEFNYGEIIKVDSKQLHEQIIQPVLLLLKEKDFENADEEYRNAHDHFRHQRNKESLNDCLKAFETTIKIICHKNQWKYEEKDPASKLIKILISNNFLSVYHESQLNAIVQVLESGAPTIRNKNGAHGQGVNKIIVNDSLASYMLYITGATIKFLVEVQKENETKTK